MTDDDAPPRPRQPLTRSAAGMPHDAGPANDRRPAGYDRMIANHQAREAFPRDIHDAVVQRLLATEFDLQRLLGKLHGTPSAPRIADAVNHIDEALVQINAARRDGQRHPDHPGPRPAAQPRHPAPSVLPMTTDPRLIDLSARERQVLSLVADGLTNRQIADRLDIAEKTVKNYVSTLLAKLGVERRTQAAIFAIQSGDSL